MSDEAALWRLEREFWLGGAEVYERSLAPGARMVLPPPAGVLQRDATIRSIREGGRWKGVEFSGCQYESPADGIAILVYRADADRGTPASRYAAQCSSTYLRSGTAWQLVLHHQTPLSSPEP
jgi:hypothetical protein